MNLKKSLIRRIKKLARKETGPCSGTGDAVRAAQLNAAISQLWQAQGTHSKADFHTHVVPLYTALLGELKRHTTPEAAEQRLLDLLVATAAACRYRWTLRLPMKRPGSDYRKYEIIYTEALVTAMAVGCLRSYASTQFPEQLATHILPQAVIDKLKADPIVWEDWLGFFQQAERGGLYWVSVCAKPAKHPRTINRDLSQAPGRQTSVKQPRVIVKPQEPPAGSGRAMLDAVRDALATGALSFNKPGDAVQVDREGRTFLEHPAILKWCSEQLALDDDVKKLKGRFSRLKVHKRSAQGNQLYYGRLSKHDRRRIGYVVENPTILWQESPPVGRFVIEHVTGQPS